MSLFRLPFLAWLFRRRQQPAPPLDTTGPATTYAHRAGAYSGPDGCDDRTGGDQ